MLTVDQLKAAWNDQADQYNSWDELGLDEIVYFAPAQACAGARDMLIEAAKQFRLMGDSGHAVMCDRHSQALSGVWRCNGSGCSHCAFECHEDYASVSAMTLATSGEAMISVKRNQWPAINPEYVYVLADDYDREAAQHALTRQDAWELAHKALIAENELLRITKSALLSERQALIPQRDQLRAQVEALRDLLRQAEADLLDWCMSFPDANSSITDALLEKIDDEMQTTDL